VTLDVIIVNFHSAPLIQRTVSVAERYSGGQARFVLVDNSPGDGAADILRSLKPDAVVISNPVNRGYAAAVNQGVAAGVGDILLLLNPDVDRVTGSHDDAVRAFADPRVAAVAARLRNPDGTVQRSCFRAPRPFDLVSEDLALAQRFPHLERARRYRMLDWDYGAPRLVDAATGAFLLLRRAALDDVGPFDERFFVYCEEVDWQIRAARHGWRTQFLPALEAYHETTGSSPGVRSRSSLLLLESQHRYSQKHFGRPVSVALRATLLGIDAARVVRHAAGGSCDRRDAAIDRIRVHVTARAPRPA
jgi:GT2 family glycosyltransferase